jgi:hypothetical protein
VVVRHHRLAGVAGADLTPADDQRDLDLLAQPSRSSSRLQLLPRSAIQCRARKLTRATGSFQDGGDVELVGFDAGEGLVRLRLVGACSACPISTMTVKQGIERRIRTAIPEVREVQAV